MAVLDWGLVVLDPAMVASASRVGGLAIVIHLAGAERRPNKKLAQAELDDQSRSHQGLTSFLHKLALRYRHSWTQLPASRSYSCRFQTRSVEGFVKRLSQTCGLIVAPHPLIRGKLIIDLAARNHLPAVYPFRFHAQDGGLVSYGIDRVDRWRSVANADERALG